MHTLKEFMKDYIKAVLRRYLMLFKDEISFLRENGKLG